jgi:hypothetical protein
MRCIDVEIPVFAAWACKMFCLLSPELGRDFSLDSVEGGIENRALQV